MAKMARVTLAWLARVTRNLTGCWPWITFGAATTDWANPNGVGLMVGESVGVEVSW